MFPRPQGDEDLSAGAWPSPARRAFGDRSELGDELGDDQKPMSKQSQRLGSSTQLAGAEGFESLRLISKIRSSSAG